MWRTYCMVCFLFHIPLHVVKIEYIYVTQNQVTNSCLTKKTTTQHQPSCLNDFLRKTYYDFMRTNSVYSYAKYKFHVVNIDMKRELLLLLWKRHMNAGKVYLTVPSLNHCVATYFLAFSQTIPETGQSCPQGKKDA